MSQTTMVQDVKVQDFAQHMEECNLDFKENVLKKVITLKLKDTAELNVKVTSFII